MEVPASYLEDASGYRGAASRLFTPESAGEVTRIVAEAAAARTPITLAGAGTGLTGGRVAQSGWVVSLERFRRLEIRPGYAIAGAGVSLCDLQAAASAAGQFFPPDPTEWTASVGGAIATNASGSRSFLYGSTRRWIRTLTAVTMDGTVHTWRRGDAPGFPIPAIRLPRSTKNTAGYPLQPGMDWIDLIAGSEGTLATVLEAELTLLPTPGELATGVFFFPGEAAALHAVDSWRSIPGLRMLEFMDAASLDLLRPRFPDIPRAAAAALLGEQETSSPEDLDRWLDRAEIARADPSSWFAASPADRERFRAFRHALPERINARARSNGFMKLATDYAVPIESNPAMLAEYHRVLEPEFHERYAIFGHIGDAHLHVNLLPESTVLFERGTTLLGQLAATAVKFGGTVSAEHGLGKRKAHLLLLQYSPAEIGAMRAVKERLDPAWLLNRGNLFPVPGA